MFCGNCGAEIQPGQQYCNRCGKPASAPVTGPAAPVNPGAPAGTTPPAAVRVDRSKHIRLLAILWLIFSGLRLLGSLGILAFGRFWFPSLGRWGMPMFPFNFRGFVGPLMLSFGLLHLGAALAGLIAGWGLLERAHWSRILALVVGAIALVSPPLGTALGIYTLWVLLPTQSAREFRPPSRVS
jgi:hypothetical protein